MDNWTQDTVLGLLRHVLTTAGGGLVTHGYLTGSQETDAVGAVITLLGIGWSVYEKYARSKTKGA